MTWLQNLFVDRYQHYLGETNAHNVDMMYLSVKWATIDNEHYLGETNGQLPMHIWSSLNPEDDAPFSEEIVDIAHSVR